MKLLRARNKTVGAGLVPARSAAKAYGQGQALPLQNYSSLTVFLVALKLLAAALLLCAAASAQEPAGVGGRFQKDGLSFDYPAGWVVNDKSNEQAQDLTLTRPDSLAVVRVVAYREPLQSVSQIRQVRNQLTQPFVEALARRLGLTKPEQWGETACIKLGGRVASGYKMAGSLNGKPATGEVYSVIINGRLVHLTYVRSDRDEAAGAPAWKTLLDTLKIEPSANTSPDVDALDRTIVGGVLNGKALKKPAPRYPVGASATRAQGVVVVQLTVDERGDVIAAKAISGEPMLRGAAEEAARKAKFSPTLLCGRPVKVSGIITYNFVLLR